MVVPSAVVTGVVSVVVRPVVVSGAAVVVGAVVVAGGAVVAGGLVVVGGGAVVAGAVVVGGAVVVVAAVVVAGAVVVGAVVVGAVVDGETGTLGSVNPAGGELPPEPSFVRMIASAPPATRSSAATAAIGTIGQSLCRAEAGRST